MLPDIKKDFQLYWEGRRGGKRLQNTLRASSIGFACDRNQYYSLTESKEPPSWELAVIFEEGNLHEPAIEGMLRKMGYEVEGSQKEFRLEKPLITMHIDGLLRKNSDWYPWDAKTINPWDFEKLNSAEDFIHSQKPHQRNYPTQILLYMLANNAEYGCLILKNKQSGQLKDIWFSFEQHVSILDEGIKRAERVYKARESQTPPERISDRSLCPQCDFKSICVPDLLAEGGIAFLDSPELLEMLERRETLKEGVKEYEELDAHIKDLLKETGTGEKAIGPYLATIKEITTTRKKPITFTEEKTSYLKISIEKI